MPSVEDITQSVFDSTLSQLVLQSSFLYVPKTIVSDLRLLTQRRKKLLCATRLSLFALIGIVFFFIPELWPWYYNVLYGIFFSALNETWPETSNPTIPRWTNGLVYASSTIVGMAIGGKLSFPLFRILSKLRYGKWDIYEDEITPKDKQKLLNEGYTEEAITEILEIFHTLQKRYPTLKQEIKSAHDEFCHGNHWPYEYSLDAQIKEKAKTSATPKPRPVSMLQPMPLSVEGTREVEGTPEDFQFFRPLSPLLRYLSDADNASDVEAQENTGEAIMARMDQIKQEKQAKKLVGY